MKTNSDREKFIESLAVVLHNTLEELKSRPLEDLSSKDLSVIQQLVTKMRQEIAPLQYFTREYGVGTNEFLNETEVEIALPFVY